MVTLEKLKISGVFRSCEELQCFSFFWSTFINNHPPHHSKSVSLTQLNKKFWKHLVKNQTLPLSRAATAGWYSCSTQNNFALLWLLDPCLAFRSTIIPFLPHNIQGAQMKNDKICSDLTTRPKHGVKVRKDLKQKPLKAPFLREKRWSQTSPSSASFAAKCLQHLTGDEKHPGAVPEDGEDALCLQHLSCKGIFLNSVLQLLLYSHRIPRWFGLKRTLKFISFHPFHFV